MMALSPRTYKRLRVFLERCASGDNACEDERESRALLALLPERTRKPSLKAHWKAHLITDHGQFISASDTNMVSPANPLLRLLAKSNRRKVAGKSPESRRPKKGQRLEAMSELRRKVFERAKMCEAFKAGFGCYPEAQELDHLISGSGNRRRHQNVETCWAICGMAHRTRTREPEALYTTIVKWAARHGYAVPKQIEDRHAKHRRMNPTKEAV